MKKITFSLIITVCFVSIAFSQTMKIKDVKKVVAKYKGQNGISEIEKLLNKGIEAKLKKYVEIGDCK